MDSVEFVAMFGDVFQRIRLHKLEGIAFHRPVVYADDVGEPGAAVANGAATTAAEKIQ